MERRRLPGYLQGTHHVIALPRASFTNVFSGLLDEHCCLGVRDNNEPRETHAANMNLSRPQVSLYWMLYESFKTRFIPGYTASSSRAPSHTVSGLSERELTARYLLTSSAACGIAVTFTNPIDAVQARWQTSAGKSGGLNDIVKAMWRVGGSSAFLRGIGARLAYTVSPSAVV